MLRLRQTVPLARPVWLRHIQCTVGAAESSYPSLGFRNFPIPTRTFERVESRVETSQTRIEMCR